MAAVDEEIGVERENVAIRMDLGETDQAGIRKRHRPVSIAAHEGPEIRLLVMDRERDANHSAFQKGEEGIGILAFPFQKERRFGQNRFTGEQRRRNALPLFNGP